MEVKRNTKEMDAEKYYFPVVFEKNPHGIAITVVGLENIITVADTMEEAVQNAQEAIRGHIALMDQEELEPFKQQPQELSVQLISVEKPK